jgi:hypothetical protein
MYSKVFSAQFSQSRGCVEDLDMAISMVAERAIAAAAAITAPFDGGPATADPYLDQ